MVQKVNVHGEFQQNYIQRCTEVGEPLTLTQISALEQTIGQFFGFSSNSMSSLTIDPLANQSMQSMDRAILEEACRQVGYQTPKRQATAILNVIRTFNSVPYVEPTTDADALSLYNRSVETIRQSRSRDPIKKWRGDKPRNYTLLQFKAIHAYLYARGIIVENEPLKLSKLR